MIYKMIYKMMYKIIYKIIYFSYTYIHLEQPLEYVYGYSTILSHGSEVATRVGPCWRVGCKER